MLQMSAMGMKYAIAIGGASGSIYAKVLLNRLKTIESQIESVGLIMSDNAKYNWELELGNKDYQDYGFRLYDKLDFMAPFASGSAQYDGMIICPCSMGILGRIAAGISDDLITRAADVMLKERKKLILVPRETPYNLIHIRNMETITLAGGTICPAVPSFYSNPATMDELVQTVIDRVLQLAGFKLESYRWGE